MNDLAGWAKRVGCMLLGLALAAGCATSTTNRLRLPPLQTVARVDLSRYLGTWYEIANFPQSFQRGCTATTATYTLRNDGAIDVLNRRRKSSVDGEVTKLLVSFARFNRRNLLAPPPQHALRSCSEGIRPCLSKQSS